MYRERREGKNEGGRKEERRWKGDVCEIRRATRRTLKSLLVLTCFDMQ